MTTQPATPPPVKYLSFSAGINQQTVQGLIGVMSNYHNQAIPKIYFTLSTSGGDVDPGIHLYNYLRGLPFELTLHNVGHVNSVGIIVFLAGQKRYASPNATFMFHGVGINVSQGERLEEQQLRDKLEVILRGQDRIGSIIQERTKLDKETIAGLFSKAQTKDAAWAKEHGFIDEIRELEIPPGIRVDALTVQPKAT